MKIKFVILLSVLMAVQLLLSPSLVNGEMVFPWPLVSTSSATGITSTTAVLNGELTRTTGWVPCALVSFMYGKTSGAYTSETTQQLLCDNGTFSASIGNLQPCTRYYVIAKAARPGGTALLPSTGDTGIYGAGFGLFNIETVTKLLFSAGACTVYGSEISFTTIGCTTTIGTGAMSNQSNGISNVVPSPKPVMMTNIAVQAAAISRSKVSPGEKVEVTANVINKGGSNGDAKVTLYVNGQEVESRGVTLAGGATTPVHFYVSRNEPGTYSVYVGGVSAGSFVVDLFTNNDSIIYSIIALFVLGIAGILYMITKKRAA